MGRPADLSSWSALRSMSSATTRMASLVARCRLQPAITRPTSTAENVSPVPIENKIIELCPMIANCVVVGDKRKFLSCLISLKTEVNPLTGEPSDKLLPAVVEAIKKEGGSATTLQEARNDEAVKKMVEAAIEGYNKVAISRAQEVRKWYLMERDLSLSHGELTATLKMKRNVVHQHYEKDIESMYTENK